MKTQSNIKIGGANQQKKQNGKIKSKKDLIKSKKDLIAERKYLIRSRIAAARKQRMDNHPINNRYVVSRHSASLARTARYRFQPDPVKPKKSTAVQKFGYSGTIIFDGKLPLHPFKWSPTDSENSPNHYRWESLLPGTHVLDKNTCLVWIVERPNFLAPKNKANNKEKSKTNNTSSVTGQLSLAPCQTIRLEMNLPSQLNNFNPGLCLNPYLPETKRIPIGTRLIFKDSNQCYVLKDNCQLAPLMGSSGSNRPSQIIPIPINSLYNTIQLVGLNTLVTHSPLQKRTPSLKGYQTLEEWLEGLIPGNQTLPGYLGDLPKISQLQAYDVLEFYDPALGKNPRINGLNPDGTQYIDGLHESRYFSFRLQVMIDAKGRLSGRRLTSPISQYLCNINLPVEQTNLGRPIYLRSAALIPYLGEPIIILNQVEDPYYLDQENDDQRLCQDLLTGLLKTGYPYQQIKIDYLGQVQDFYTLRFNNLPSHIWGVVLSSDTMPHNKFQGSGRFFLGYTANSQGTTYSCELEAEDGSPIELSSMKVQDVTIDGILVNNRNDPGFDLSRNQETAQLLGQINQKLSDVGYPGYVMNLWWNESSSRLKFFLSGIVNQQLPQIMLNINQTLISLDFRD